MIVAAMMVAAGLLANESSAAEPAAGDEVAEITIRTLSAQMKYDLEAFRVAPGTRVRLLFDNQDMMIHNLIVCDAGDDKGMEVALAAWELADEGFERAWIPEHPRVLAASSLLQPNTSEVIEFTAPETPGIYPYVCTIPGHAMLMHGEMRVEDPGRLFEELRFELHLGNWQRLPDFDAMEPHRSGELHEGRLDILMEGHANEFGLRFSGRLQIPEDGDYTFFLASDDGSRLYLDGGEIIDNDGVHNADEVKQATVPLQAGQVDVRLDYFERRGDKLLFMAWQGPSFGETILSTDIHPSRQAAAASDEDPAGMPLMADGDEAVIYRNFIRDAGSRAIGVGYSNGVNQAFNANTVNLALLWRGAFIDAQRHWSGRGQGFQGVLGYEAFAPAPGPALHVLESPDDEWPAINGNDRSQHLRFLGYELDELRRPTFRYQGHGVVVRDKIEPRGHFSEPGLEAVRLVVIEGEPAPGLHLIAAADATLVAGDGGYHETDHHWQVKVEGAEAILRRQGEGGDQQLLVPVTAPGEFRIIYRWIH